MEYYKVTRADLSSILYHKHSVQYELKKWILPTLLESKLFVFDNLKHTLDFQRTVKGDTRIFFCKIANPPMITHWVCRFYPSFKSFWQNPTSFAESIRPPDGTLGVDAVKLIREIDEKHQSTNPLHDPCSGYSWDSISLSS